MLITWSIFKLITLSLQKLFGKCCSLFFLVIALWAFSSFRKIWLWKVVWNSRFILIYWSLLPIGHLIFHFLWLKHCCHQYYFEKSLMTVEISCVSVYPEACSPHGEHTYEEASPSPLTVHESSLSLCPCARRYQSLLMRQSLLAPKGAGVMGPIFMFPLRS